jgi:RNA polymerase sigma-70 factor, ECF subfamily
MPRSFAQKNSSRASSWLKKERINDEYNLEVEVLKRINSTEILKYVLALPLHYRKVLFLYYYLDFNTLEIASASGNPEGTIRGRLHRARKLLKEQLEKEGIYQ